MILRVITHILPETTFRYDSQIEDKKEYFILQNSNT
jgi:hypothetical protein